MGKDVAAKQTLHNVINGTSFETLFHSIRQTLVNSKILDNNINILRGYQKLIEHASNFKMVNLL